METMVTIPMAEYENLQKAKSAINENRLLLRQHSYVGSYYFNYTDVMAKEEAIRMVKVEIESLHKEIERLKKRKWYQLL